MPSPDAQKKKQEQSPIISNGPSRLPEAERFLSAVLAKSAGRSGSGPPETLTDHSLATRKAAMAVARRIGAPGVLAAHPRFWAWAEWAALLHDAGKVAALFQRQVEPRGEPWGERHEVLSLAYVDLLTAGLPEQDRAMIAAGVVFHHRCLDGDRGLTSGYPPEEETWQRKFGVNPAAPPGYRAQVPPARHAALVAWLAAQLAVELPAREPGRKLWQRARDQFAAVQARWSDPVPEAVGLIAVLLQGAVTLADHSASAHVELDTETPVPPRYITTIAAPYPHQSAAAATDGHLILIAPTGSGKTEAGVGWASRQMESMPGEPRLVWLLPYRASIDAIRDRFAEDFKCGANGIGILHATAAATLLSIIVRDDCSPGQADARKARAMGGAMRLFRQRVRVATPHQLLRAAIAGPKYASVLLEQANSALVLDELHAYDPVTFGRICAAMQLWDRLGSRVAVVSATLAPPMIELVGESLGGAVTVRKAAPGTAPLRHRLVLDDQPLTAPGSLDRIRDRLAGGRSVLVVANRVNAAQEIFRELAPDQDDDSALLLHSRFRYGDRRAIEERIRRRHPERRPGQPAQRSGGLVVSTQALEVSLCLDFDCGASELAPVEAIAQRAGRVNRRGLHPEGPAEFRVHQVESPRPYDDGAMQAAMLALGEWDGRLISEQAVDEWLERAYRTPWGQAWADKARWNRDEFAATFLAFTEPFRDRGEFAAGLDQQFDTVEVLLRRDAGEYRTRAFGDNGDPLLAADLLIPVSWSQKARLQRARRADFAPDLGLWLIDAPYDARTGLDLTAAAGPDPRTDTIL